MSPQANADVIDLAKEGILKRERLDPVSPSAEANENADERAVDRVAIGVRYQGSSSIQARKVRSSN